MKRPENVKRLHTFIDESIHHRMRIQAVHEGKSLREFVEHTALYYFKDNEIDRSEVRDARS